MLKLILLIFFVHKLDHWLRKLSGSRLIWVFLSTVFSCLTWKLRIFWLLPLRRNFVTCLKELIGLTLQYFGLLSNFLSCNVWFLQQDLINLLQLIDLRFLLSNLCIGNFKITSLSRQAELNMLCRSLPDQSKFHVTLIWLCCSHRVCSQTLQFYLKIVNQFLLGFIRLEHAEQMSIFELDIVLKLECKILLSLPILFHIDDLLLSLAHLFLKYAVQALKFIDCLVTRLQIVWQKS